MSKINLMKYRPIVPVRPAMRTAQRFGVNPYDNHGSVMRRYEDYMRMCGAVPSVAMLIERRQAE